MATSFVRSLVEIQQAHQSELDSFKSAWKKARERISRVLAEAAEALDKAKPPDKNSKSPSLLWRGEHIAFKSDKHERKIICSVSTGEQEKRYDPDTLKQETIEDEVRDFVRSVLDARKEDRRAVVK